MNHFHIKYLADKMAALDKVSQAADDASESGDYDRAVELRKDEERAVWLVEAAARVVVEEWQSEVAT